MAADPSRQQWNQRSVTSAQLAKAYRVTDLDGTLPDIWAYMEAEAKGLNPQLADFRELILEN
jgi:hypothetical protein